MSRQIIVAAIVGNGEQANNRALNAMIGLAAAGKRKKKKTISETDPAKLTRGRVDHIHSLDSVNKHIDSSVKGLNSALDARRQDRLKPPPMTSTSVNAQLLTLQQRLDLAKAAGDLSQAVQIQAMIDRFNTLYLKLVEKETENLF